MKVVIIGMGFVGSSLAGGLAGPDDHRVTGIDPSFRDFHEPGLAHALTRVHTALSLAALPPFDVYVICVGTPVNSLEAITKATREVAAHMCDGALVIIRSTVPIGTTRNIIKPILDATGVLHYQLAVCPERTVEGNALAELAQLPQIIGAETSEAKSRTIALFRPLGCETFLVPNYETAEMAKLLANSWRDTTFAYANEVALIAEQHGISARTAIQAANWNYPRCAIPMPGPVGGPCLVKDSRLLVDVHNRRPISAARDLNEHIVAVTAVRLNRLAAERGIKHPKCALLGTAFKGQPETDDTRDSPGLALRWALIEMGWQVTTVDPLAPADFNCDTWANNHDTYDVVIVATNHPIWRGMGLRSYLTSQGFIYDWCGGVDEFDYRFGG